jgi:hypothetical protein
MALLALVPRALTTGRFETTDEVQWMERSRNFGDALLRLDPAAASTLRHAPGPARKRLNQRAGRRRGARMSGRHLA